MDLESGAPTSPNPSQLSWVNLSRNLLLAYQSFGVVYGDMSTSPLYVYQSTFDGKMQKYLNEETVFGAFSLIFWTFTLIPLLKYVFILLSADDNGEGGTFALYSLLCRHAKFNLLPNQQAADEELSSYKYGISRQAAASFPLKKFLEKHKRSRSALLVVVLLAASMVVGDGALACSMSVLSAVSGIQVTERKFTHRLIVWLACVILVGLFALQQFGTHKVAFLFAPILIIWLLSILLVGLYNTIYWNPKVLCAISPHYIFVFFRKTGIEGYFSLGGVLLCITGAEAMFTDLGHFSALSIRIAFSFVVYPCLVVQYMGQAAFLSKNPTSISRAFFSSIPLPVFWPVFVIATLAAIAGSQAVITATFSIVNQCQALDCFPRVKVVHTSSNIHGQIYIPEINWILMVLTLVITIGFQDLRLIGNAYGLAVMMVMFVTTFLMALVLIFIWQKSNLMAMAFLLFFWAIEGLYLAAVLTKVRDGGWVPLVISFVFMTVMLVWHYGSCRKHSFDLENKASMQWILALGPSLGIVRVPGIGFIYSEQATGVPAVFSHFVTNLPALHKVLVFVCVKSVIVPYVPPQERFLIGRVGPRPFRMYRCIVRYGYKDIHCHDGDFENQVIQSIAEFTHREAIEPRLSSGVSSPVSSVDEKMRVISDRISCSSLVMSENEGVDLENSISIARAASRSNLQRIHEEENSPVRKRKVRFQVAENPPMDPDVGEELTDLVEAKEAGVAYVLGHLVVKAKKSSSFLKKLVIDVGYAFLRQNCRGRAVALNIPHVSLIEIGMTYYV